MKRYRRYHWRGETHDKARLSGRRRVRMANNRARVGCGSFFLRKGGAELAMHMSEILEGVSFEVEALHEKLVLKPLREEAK
jgi:hypothetical protein